jgi:hypothetical protein
MKDKLTDILASCLEAIEKGERTAAECLALYPEHRQQLQALLRTAAAVQARAGFSPRPGLRQASRARLVKRLAVPQPAPIGSARRSGQKPGLSFIRRFAMTGIAIAVLVASLVSGGTVYASSFALPGDRLYTVKLVVEDARLLLSDDAGDVTLHIQFLQRRVDEIQALVEADRDADLPLAMGAFSGQVSAAAQSLAAIAGKDSQRAFQLALLLDGALSNHTETLIDLLETVPDQARPAVETAITASGRGREIVQGLFTDSLPGDGSPEGVPGKPEDSGPPGGIPGKPDNPGPPGTPPSGPPSWVPGDPPKPTGTP